MQHCFAEMKQLTSVLLARYLHYHSRKIGKNRFELRLPDAREGYILLIFLYKALFSFLTHNIQVAVHIFLVNVHSLCCMSLFAGGF